MTPLHTAIPLEQMNDLTLGISQDLHLDMPRIDHRLLQIHHRITECRIRLPRRRLDRLSQPPRISHPPHPATTTARHRLDEQRELHPPRRGDQLLHRRRRLRRCQHRQPRRPRRRDRPRLVPRQLQHVSRRPDKRDPRIRTRRRQLRILRQEPIPRVDRIRPGMPSHPNDLVHRQIRPHRMPRLTNLIRLISLQPMQRIPILIRIHRDSRDTHLGRRAERADRYLATIGHQHLGDHEIARWGCPLYSLRGRISALDAACSMMCAVHPVIRLITKIGVKHGMSKPIR